MLALRLFVLSFDMCDSRRRVDPDLGTQVFGDKVAVGLWGLLELRGWLSSLG